MDCSWWIFRTSTLQLVNFSDKHFAVGGFLFLGGGDITVAYSTIIQSPKQVASINLPVPKCLLKLTVYLHAKIPMWILHLCPCVHCKILLQQTQIRHRLIIIWRPLLILIVISYFTQVPLFDEILSQDPNSAFPGKTRVTLMHPHDASAAKSCCNNLLAYDIRIGKNTSSDTAISLVTSIQPPVEWGSLKLVIFLMKSLETIYLAVNHICVIRLGRVWNGAVRPAGASNRTNWGCLTQIAGSH